MIELAITKVLNLQTDSHVKNAIKYAISDKKDPENENVIYPTFTTYINSISNVSATKISNSWKCIRQKFEKDNGRLAFQIVQNFGDGINPKLANEIGVKFASELLGNRQIIVSTHTNTDYTHNHIIFNSPDIVTGEKYYDNMDSYYNKVRKISDRLCDEYGLKVLEDTREGTLVFYKDKSGKTRAFEPTKRKSELEHYDSRYAQADVWNKDLRRRKNRTLKIISDMDMLIPTSNDFEDFLQKMRNMGYKIKAKTSKGEWRQHITYFEPDKPDTSRGIRDSNKFLAGYSRLEIEKKISKFRKLSQEQKREEESIFSDIQNDTKNSNYDITLINKPKVFYDDVDKISDVVRHDKTKRTKVDKLLVSEIKTMRKQVNDDFYSAFKRSSAIQPRTVEERKELDTLKRISLKVHTLNFMESYKIYAPSVLESKMKQILSMRNNTAKELDEIRSKLNVMNSYVATINRANSLKSHIDSQTEIYGKSYTEVEGQTEIQTYDELSDKLKSVNLYQREQQKSYIENVEHYRLMYSQLVSKLQFISNSLYQCDDIYRIMKQCGYENENEIKRYEQIRFVNRNDKKGRLDESIHKER